jgi:hypothetical protein
MIVFSAENHRDDPPPRPPARHCPISSHLSSQAGSNTGELVRIKGSHRTLIATGLNFPTAMTVGPDGNLYVSVNGLGGPPDAGQVVRIVVSTGYQDQ